MTEGPREDQPVDPDLLVLDELEERLSLQDVEFDDVEQELPDDDEPVESYVPPYVPDPPPEMPVAKRAPKHDTRSPRWFRILFLTAVMLLVAAVGAILHRTGVIEDWFASIRGGEAESAYVGPERKVDTRETGVPGPGPSDPRPVPEPEPDQPDPTLPRPEPLPDAPEDPGLPPPEVELPPAPKPVIVETSDHRKITLLEGEILVELRNGNYLKGRLHKVTDAFLRLVMDGGYVDVELSRLRKPPEKDDGSMRAIESYPRARVQLITGEILAGRLVRSEDQDVELVFPSGRVVLRRDMVKYIDRR